MGEGCVSGCKVLYSFLEKGWEGVGVKERGKGINEDGLDAFGELGIGCFGNVKRTKGNSASSGQGAEGGESACLAQDVAATCNAGP